MGYSREQAHARFVKLLLEIEKEDQTNQGRQSFSAAYCFDSRLLALARLTILSTEKQKEGSVCPE
jgi:hypothetical protein